MSATELTELASGVDSLYISGRCDLPGSLITDLETAKLDALDQGSPVGFEFGGYDWELKPSSLHRYRYWLDHPLAAVGITPSDKLPSLFVQFRSEGIHSIGADGVLSWLAGAIGNASLSPVWSVSRIDLHADWQGWNLNGDHRRRFVCRSRSLATYEEGPELSGFSFGNRRSKTITARIYDKTNEIATKGGAWLFEAWGNAFDADLPALRVEFEISRNALREMALHDPATTLGQVDRMWAYATREWLTYRSPSDHSCVFRWPVAHEWRQIQNATLAGSAVPITRITDANRAAELERILPALNGYMATFGALTGNDTIDDACDALKPHMLAYENRSRRSFCNRVHERQRKQP